MVDQFEELLTVTPPNLRASFIDVLLDLADPADERRRVILTMRQDYVNLCNVHGRLKERLEGDKQHARFRLARMSADGLRNIVNELLRLAGIGTADREALLPPLHHENMVIGAVYDRDESRTLTWSADNTVRLWDAATGNEVLPTLRQKSFVKGAAFKADETQILSWSHFSTR